MKRLYKRQMRALSTICCVICMIFMLLSGTEYAYAWNSAEIVAVSGTAEKGGIAKVVLKLSDNPGIWGLKFQVGYDHNVMKLKNVNVGDVFTQGEITSPESYDKETYIFYATGSQLSNITTNGTLVVLEFQLSDTAKAEDYTISLEFIQCINIDGKDVKVKMTDGKVTIADCLHSQTEWKITEDPKCEQKGKETESCKKCGEVLGMREIKETGHQNTAVRNAKQATVEKEGYTGEWDHDGENIRTATTITAVYTKVEEPVNNTDLSDYADFQLPVYANSRVTNIATGNGAITVEGYMFKANANLDNENSIWREIIFVNEEDYSMAKAYRKQVTPVYNTWLNKNMTATGNGTYALDYANYTVNFSNTDINNYVGNTAATRMATGSYLAYMRISDGTDSYLFPLKDIVLSDGSTLALPSGFEVVDTTTRALRYIVK